MSKLAEKLPLIVQEDIYDVELKNYLCYTNEVIGSRAIPDARDGLKPVQRRVLYCAYEFNSKVKSARIVGDAMGRFHPHGNSAIYEALVNLVQPWSTKEPLMIGQGNFGNIGDNAAAMRYTEAKLSPIGRSFFTHFNKKTSFMKASYDNNEEEPIVLPVAFPALLVNGTQGIASAIATKIAPHNLREVCQGIIAYIKNPQISIEELIKIIPGPDFPLKCKVFASEKNLKEIFETGRGMVTIFGECEIKDHSIIIKSLPYNTSKQALIQKLIEIQSKKLIGIKAIQDESSKNLRIVVKLLQTVNSQVALNSLYNQTSLKSNFHSTWFAIDELGKPRLYNLISYFRDFLKYRHQIIIANATYSLAVLKKELSKYLSFLIVREKIDEIIKIIKGSFSNEDIVQKLMKLPCKIPENFDKSYLNIKGDSCFLSKEQADIIMATKISQLSSHEKDRLIDLINKSKEKMDIALELIEKTDIRSTKIIEELEEIARKYGQDRKSEIMREYNVMSALDYIEKKDVVISINNNYIKRIDLQNYRIQRTGGKGSLNNSIGLTIKSNTHDKLLFFFEKKVALYIDVYKIPKGTRSSKGKAYVNLVPQGKGKIIKCLSYNHEILSKKYILFVFDNGNVRKNYMEDFLNINKSGKIYKQEESKIVDIICANDGDDILLTSQKGKVLRVSVDNFNIIKSRTSNGVKGINLYHKDHVISCTVSNDEKGFLFLMSKNGIGKKTLVKKFSSYNRNSRGVIGFKITKKTGEIAGAIYLPQNNEGDVLLFTKDSKTKGGRNIRFAIKDIPSFGRNASGNSIINTSEMVKSLIYCSL